VLTGEGDNLKRARKKLDSNSPRTIDWLAIRAAYETSDKSVNIIAELHGVSPSMIDRRRVKEAWPKRSDTGRIAPRPPKVDQVDWLAVRHDYETGEYSVAEVVRRHGCSRSRLQQQKELEHWEARRPAYPRAYGAGGTVKVGLEQKLAMLSTRLGLAEKMDVGDLRKAVETLAAACEKLLDAKDLGDDSDRLHINDATRNALAERLEALADSWERKRNSAGLGCTAAGAD
jgi:transposase-like protein